MLFSLLTLFFYIIHCIEEFFWTLVDGVVYFLFSFVQRIETFLDRN